MESPYEKFGGLITHNYNDEQSYCCEYIAEMLDINDSAASVIENYVYREKHAYWVDYLQHIDDIVEFMEEFIEKL